MRHFLNNIAAFIENDMPVATERGHGLGTKSIRQSAERLGGKCQYSVSDTMFIVRVII